MGASGTVDVAVVAGEHDGVELQPLVTDELLAVVPAPHPLAASPAVRARDLVDEPFILTRARCERLVLGAQGVQPNISHEVRKASWILAMVGEGLGVSLMPGLAALTHPQSWRCASPLASSPLDGSDGHVVRTLTSSPSRTLPAAWESRSGGRLFL